MLTPPVMALTPSRSVMPPAPKPKAPPIGFEGDAQPTPKAKPPPATLEDVPDNLARPVALLDAATSDPIHVLPPGTIRDPVIGVIEMMTPAENVRPAWPAVAITPDASTNAGHGDADWRLARGPQLQQDERPVVNAGGSGTTTPTTPANAPFRAPTHQAAQPMSGLPPKPHPIPAPTIETYQQRVERETEALARRQSCRHPDFLQPLSTPGGFTSRGFRAGRLVSYWLVPPPLQLPPALCGGRGVLPARRAEPGSDLAAQHAPLCALPLAGQGTSFTPRTSRCLPHRAQRRAPPHFHASGRPRLTLHCTSSRQLRPELSTPEITLSPRT